MFPLEVILTGGFCWRKWGVGWLFHYKNPFFAYVCWEWKWTLHPLGTNHGISSNEGQNRLIKEDSVKNGEYRSKIARSCDCLVFWCILNFWPGDQPLKLSISSYGRKLVAHYVPGFKRLGSTFSSWMFREFPLSLQTAEQPSSVLGTAC